MTTGLVEDRDSPVHDRAAGTPRPPSDPRGDLRPDRPTSARLASLMLAGKDHLAADRALSDLLRAEDAGCVDAVRRGREFLHHAARLLAERGLEQFLDLGCGLTTGVPGTVLAPIHTSVLTARPGARFVYLDRDPVVMAHARALLDAPAPARVRHVHADLAGQGRVQTAAVDRPLLLEAEELMRRHLGIRLGLTDCVNAALAWRLSRPALLTFDKHYSTVLAPRRPGEKRLEVHPGP
ncbi:SAM-dependent methyltransferase [Kitasatospora sp. NPDC058218]|uniref:SAM-dependent methyltransferase n=1 Tax=Kitasatospora sp. NPDC058218 TaxID=3346385 RepID=UPI0036DC8AFF